MIIFVLLIGWIASAFFCAQVAAEKWLNAFRLMAELGLRPIEVGYLKVKKDPITQEFLLVV